MRCRGDKMDGLISSYDKTNRIMMCVVISFFCLVFLFMAIVIVKTIKKSFKRSSSPMIVSEAILVSKRTYYSHMSNGPGSTAYFATFDIIGGDRIELMVPYDQIGFIAEGEQGKLYFKGDQFVKFERTN